MDTHFCNSMLNYFLKPLHFSLWCFYLLFISYLLSQATFRLAYHPFPLPEGTVFPIKLFHKNSLMSSPPSQLPATSASFGYPSFKMFAACLTACYFHRAILLFNSHIFTFSISSPSPPPQRRTFSYYSLRFAIPTNFLASMQQL